MKHVITLTIGAATIALVSCTPYDPGYRPVPGAYGPPPLRPINPANPLPNQTQQHYPHIPSPTDNSFNNPSGYSSTDPARPYRPDPIRIPQTPTTTASNQYPTATPGVKPDTVISPYAPYNVISVAGLTSGQKAYDVSTVPIDPSTGKQYIGANGRPDVKKAKIFIVP